MGVGRRYTPLDAALRALSRALPTRLGKESVPVQEAYGRVLGSDVRAPEDLPRWDVSHFDGYAVASADAAQATSGAPVLLKIRGGAVRPDARGVRALRRGEAMEVLTGGRIPGGSDAVVPLEDASREGEKVRVVSPIAKGEHVYPAGSDVKRGELVLSAGRTMVGQDAVLLASLGFARVSVLSKPRVGILPTGSELTAEAGDRRSGKVLETHSLLLERLVEGAGGSPRVFPIVPDESPALTRALREALAESDIVFTLAGSSVGGPDLVDSTLRGFGRRTTLLVHGIRVNRGRVMGVAVVGGKPVVILPGPIQGALNAFIVFGYPLIRRQLGKGMEQPPPVAATVSEDWEATGKFRSFDQVVYLRLERGSTGELVAGPSGAQTEKVSFLVSKNAYTIVPGREPRLSKGQRVMARLLPGFSTLE